jgi:hypothetical protein
MLSAISAPVLPQDTAPAASPLRTDSSADHIEVCLPLRTTWLGLSSMVTTSLASRNSTRPSRPRRFATSLRKVSSGPCRMNPISGFFSADLAIPATTTEGPASPPIASTDMTIRPVANPGVDPV